MSTLKSINLIDLKILIENSISYSDVLKKLKLSTNGSTNHKTLKKFITNNNINTDHFQIHNPNQKLRFAKYNLKDILIENSFYANISRLKIRLVKEGYLKYKCSICKLTEWQNKPISLQLDHINGNSKDHRITNLRFLCPNCHSQTDTYAGKNIKKK